MKRARWAAWFVVSGAIAIAACSSFSGTTPADEQGGDAGDDHAIPVVTGSAPDAADAGTPNLLTDGTFESNCKAWTGDHLAVTWEADHTHNHSAGACRVCFLGDNAPKGTITVNGEFAAGPNRPLSAAVFILVDSSTPALQANILTDVFSQGGNAGGGSSLPINLKTNEWAQLVLPTPFESKDASEAQVVVEVYSATSVNAGESTACVYVDDASLYFTTN